MTWPFVPQRGILPSGWFPRPSPDERARRSPGGEYEPALRFAEQSIRGVQTKKDRSGGLFCLAPATGIEPVTNP